MSGRPTPEQVRKLRAAVLMVRDAVFAQATQRRIIKEATEALQAAEQIEKTQSRVILDLVERMDCKYSGNYGFEWRFVEMLVEYESQAQTLESPPQS